MTIELSEDLWFPSVDMADSDGLLAFGGDLSVDRLMLAYCLGIFPWYSDDCPILWFSPDPRLILMPDSLKISKSLNRTIKSERFSITINKDFPKVIKNCRETKRSGDPGTWITDDMMQAYINLHEAGHAYSVEVWQDGDLVGGLYGVVVGKCFCGESMFAHVSNASKVGFVCFVMKLRNAGFNMIDCQLPTDHLKSFGAIEVSRESFLEMLDISNLSRPHGSALSF